MEEFQGQEREVIVLTTVRSSEVTLQHDVIYRLGFMQVSPEGQRGDRAVRSTVDVGFIATGFCAVSVALHYDDRAGAIERSGPFCCNARRYHMVLVETRMDIYLIWKVCRCFI